MQCPNFNQLQTIKLLTVAFIVKQLSVKCQRTSLRYPFRYRGYYYDVETGFYYLQSRYYDPEIRRFINADNLELLPELARVPGQLNLYAYCNNNPIMYTDPNGEGIFTLIAMLVGFTIAGAVTGGVVSYNNGAQGWDIAKWTLLGGAMGLATGGAVISLGGVGASALYSLGLLNTSTFLGVSASTAFSIGALAFDFTAFIVAPIYGISMQGIEYKTPEELPIFKEPQPTPPHPYTKGNGMNGWKK